MLTVQYTDPTGHRPASEEPDYGGPVTDVSVDEDTGKVTVITVSGDSSGYNDSFVKYDSMEDYEKNKPSGSETYKGSYSCNQDYSVMDSTTSNSQTSYTYTSEGVTSTTSTQTNSVWESTNTTTDTLQRTIAIMNWLYNTTSILNNTTTLVSTPENQVLTNVTSYQYYEHGSLTYDSRNEERYNYDKGSSSVGYSYVSTKNGETVYEENSILSIDSQAGGGTFSLKDFLYQGGYEDNSYDEDGNDYGSNIDISNVVGINDDPKKLKGNYCKALGAYYDNFRVRFHFPKWIPFKMEMDGSTAQEKYLKYRMTNPSFRVKWNQQKIDQLWEVTKQINNKYNIQIDPRYLLAIIIAEGTGSFDTSSTNLAADGQNGIETDYTKDLMKAESLVFGKILGYAYYGKEFDKAVKNNNTLNGIKGNGNMFQYANWATPVIDLHYKKVREGEYAGNGSWHAGVITIYEDLAYKGAAKDYSNYISSISKSTIESIAKDFGIDLSKYKVQFTTSRNSIYPDGQPDGNYTITGNPVKKYD